MTVRLRNVSPLGDLDVPILGRVVAFGEEFDCHDDIAGREPNPDPDPEKNDPGAGLLAGYFERVTSKKPADKPAPAAPVTTPAED